MWCNTKARVVLILLSFERKIDIKIKNKLFFIKKKSKLPGVSNCKHIHSCVTLMMFLNFNI